MPILPAWAAATPVAHLATSSGRYPHLVPVVFCEADEAIHIPIDGKPKSGKPLQRLANIQRDPGVCLLVDVYSDDWSKLRWIRLDGMASLETTTPAVAAALLAKYPQYAQYCTRAGHDPHRGGSSPVMAGRRPRGTRPLALLASAHPIVRGPRLGRRRP